jgi:hypothetical protein
MQLRTIVLTLTCSVDVEKETWGGVASKANTCKEAVHAFFSERQDEKR